MNKQIKSVSVIGDSLLKGIIYNENKKVYNIVEDSCVNLLQKESEFDINNFTLCGLNIENLNKYFNLVLNKTNDEIIILEIGTDSFEQDLSTNGVKTLYTKDKFNKILKKIIKKTKKEKKNLILTTIPYISNNKYYQFIMDKKGLRNQTSVLDINNFIDEVNNIIKRLSQKNNILFIDLNKGINSFNEELYSIDGKHLSLKGHNVLKDIFIDSFNKSSIYSI